MLAAGRSIVSGEGGLWLLGEYIVAVDLFLLLLFLSSLTHFKLITWYHKIILPVLYSLKGAVLEVGRWCNIGMAFRGGKGVTWKGTYSLRKKSFDGSQSSSNFSFFN